MTTGDNKNEGNAVRVQRREYDEDMIPTGTGPVVVVTQSRKMSIYGPNFNYGPIQLRKQRLLEKMKKEAETAMEKRIEELRMAQRILDEQLRSKQVAVQQVLTERKPCNVENTQKNGSTQQYQHHSAVYAIKP